MYKLVKKCWFYDLYQIRWIEVQENLIFLQKLWFATMWQVLCYILGSQWLVIQTMITGNFLIRSNYSYYFLLHWFRSQFCFVLFLTKLWNWLWFCRLLHIDKKKIILSHNHLIATRNFIFKKKYHSRHLYKEIILMIILLDIAL